MIYQQINFGSFLKAFRERRPDNFSYEALKVLYEYLEEISIENPYELDVIALCCQFSETTIGEVVDF